MLHEPDAAVRDVYFPADCLVSLLVVVERGRALEVGMVGSEGIVGLAVGFGQRASAVRTLVQGEGRAMRASAASFRRELARSPALQQAVSRHAYLSMASAMRLAGCNNAHTLEPRLARWLLMTQDRLPAARDLPLTQALLADMLGVQREGVTKAASALRRRRLISYSRGRIRILDAVRLRASACSCYAVIRKLEAAKALRGKKIH